MPEILCLITEFVTKLEKRGGNGRNLGGSHIAALMTAELLRSVISQQRISHADHAEALIQVIRDVGQKLIAANPIELATGNIVRRVLHIIRNEDLSVGDEDEDTFGEPFVSTALIACNGNQRPPSLHSLLDNKPDDAAARYTYSSSKCEQKINAADENVRSRKLKHNIITAINDLLEDIDISRGQIAEQAVEHIHENEVILTFGRSRTVLEFLCAAKDRKRTFRVFVAEGAPRNEGHVMAKELNARGLQTTVITDSAVYAMVSRVNMVIVGARAVMANGGIMAPVGINMVTLAAQKHAVPFVVLAGTHKLCPLYPHNPEVCLNDLRSPNELLDFGEYSNCMDFSTTGGDPLLHVVNPAFDYIPPELVTLLISDIGGYKPSYMYRLISDYYSAQDLAMQGRPALSKVNCLIKSDY